MADGSYGFWDGWSVLWTEPGSDDLGPGANFNPSRGEETGAPLGRDGLEFNWRAFVYPSVPFYTQPGDARVTATDFGVDAGRAAVSGLAWTGGGLLTVAAAAAGVVLFGPQLLALMKRKGV